MVARGCDTLTWIRQGWHRWAPLAQETGGTPALTGVPGASTPSRAKTHAPTSLQHNGAPRLRSATTDASPEARQQVSTATRSTTRRTAISTSNPTTTPTSPTTIIAPLPFHQAHQGSSDQFLENGVTTLAPPVPYTGQSLWKFCYCCCDDPPDANRPVY